MQHPTRTLVSLDAGIDEQTVRASLPVSTDIQIVGIVRGVDETWTTLQETPADLLVVACSGYSERTLFLITSVVKERPGMPIVVLAQDSPDGFLRRVFEVGADDAVRLPESPEQVNFMLQKVLVRGAAGTMKEHGNAPMICVLGQRAEQAGRDDLNLAVALRERESSRRRPRSTVRRWPSPWASADTAVYDLVRVGRVARRPQAHSAVMPHRAACALVAPAVGSTWLHRPEFLREVYPLLRATSDYVVLDGSPG